MAWHSDGILAARVLGWVASGTDLESRAQLDGS